MSKKPKGRVAVLKEKYKTVPDFVFDYFISNDPSGNNKYLDWLIWSVSSHSRTYKIKDQFKSNDYVKEIIRAVNLFHKTQDRLNGVIVMTVCRKFDIYHNLPYERIKLETGEWRYSVKNSKDIQTYKVSPNTLFRIIEGVKELAPTENELRNERVTLRNDDMVSIIVPLTRRASCKYGSGTKWCTASTRGSNYFDHYTKNNEGLIYFDFKKTGKYLTHRIKSNRKLALHWTISNHGRTTYAWFDTLDCEHRTNHVNDWLKLYTLTYGEGSAEQRENKSFYFSKEIHKIIKSHILRSKKLNLYQRFRLYLRGSN